MESKFSNESCPEKLDNAVAIVGMSCRFPEADNIEEFWDLLLNGRDGIKEPPIWRWNGDEELAHDPDVRNQKAGFLKCPVDDFDAKFFGISPREAENMDPQQRLLLEVTWESLENAGINPMGLKGTNTGVFSGVWKQDYEKLIMKYSPEQLLRFQEDFLGSSFSGVSARLAFQLGLNGPNIATESGCASSMISLHLACQSLNLGDTDLAIVGGVNLLLHPFTVQSMSAKHILAPDGRCKTFDASADGYGRAEGCASIVLKRYQDAVKQGDRILALIRGSAINQEGTSTNFGTPTKECQAACIQAAVKNAKISPNMVSYIEAHGTGTVTGDPVEILGIAQVYSSDRHDPLWIGSVKSNIGHTESCAGLAGLIKVILAMQNETIPPHINCDNVNPKIDLGAIPASIAKIPVEWKTYGNNPRIAGVNSFGMTGANVHIIVQEPPVDTSAKLRKQSESESYQIMAISGKSEYSLKELTNRYKSFLELYPNNLENFCYTANLTRAMWNRRIAVIGKNSKEMVSCMEKDIVINSKGVSPKSPVVFLFTGQGCQYFGMGEVLYKNNQLFRYHLDECSEILEKFTNYSLYDILWTENYLPKNEIHIYDQISIFCIEYCVSKLWEYLGVVPDIILGHSMGEFAAAVVSGILQFEDALKIMIGRSKVVEDLPEGGMLVVRAKVEEVEELLGKCLNQNDSEWLDIAVINSDSQTVVAGRFDNLKKFSEFLAKNLIKSTFIASSRAYHSRDIDLCLPDFDNVLSQFSYGVPKCKYISSSTGELVTEQVNKEYWKRNARMTVNFKKAFDLVLQEGGRVFVELGPQPILLGIGNNIASKDISKDCLWVPSMRKSGDEWKTFLEGVGNLFVNGFDIDWKSFYSHFHHQKIAIPTYPFEHSRKYWVEKKTGSSSLGGLSRKSLHPLIGNKICVPNTENAFHQQKFNLEQFSFFRDHIIGQKVIVPGATYLEMIVAAGHSSVQKSFDHLKVPVTPILIKNFNIKAAWEMQDGSDYVLCMDARPIHEEKNWSVTISRQIVGDNGQISWLTNATGTFSYYPHVSNESMLNLEEIKNNSTHRDSSGLYSSVGKVGWNFGNIFKSIKNIWENEAEVLVEIQTAEDCNGYYLHPIILDGMLQSFLMNPRFGGGLKHFALPIGIKKFVFYPSKSLIGASKFYTYVKKDDESILKLYDENGNIAAKVEEIDFMETSISSLHKALNSQMVAMPTLHEVVWRKSEIISDEKVDNNVLTPSKGDTNPAWLIFTNENDLLNNIKTKLEKARKSVIYVNSGESYSKDNDNYIVDPNDVSQLFETSNTSNVEGVVFMWGIGNNNSFYQSQFCKPLLNIIQKLINSKLPKQLILVTKGAVSISNEEINNPDANTLLGLLKSAKAEQPDLDFKSLDLDPTNDNGYLDVDEILSLMNNTKSEIQYASRNGKLYVPRLSKVNLPLTMEIPVSNRFNFKVPSNNSISDVGITPSQIQNSPKGNEVEVSVVAAGLNFRDIMAIMKPEGYHTKYPEGIGYDFSGVVTGVGPDVTKFKIGDEVAGIAYSGAICSHTITSECYTVIKPKGMTHFEAACLPVVFSTAYDTIANIGQLSSTDTILIHSASGGVGLMAIQIAQRIGAKIIATAGSDRKRLYLKSLGIDHVFNSRTVEYAENILKVTNGKGVDVVLNTLTSANFKEMTLSICSQNARFVEISKANIWQPAEVAALRPDVKYSIFDLEQLDEPSTDKLVSKIGEYRPIPYTRFELGQVKDAFKYLQKVKHIGKVVIAIPQFEIDEGRPKLSSKLFNEESTYLITGGLGGIGLEVAKWMLSLGAKHIVLVGRKLPDENVSKILESYNSQGACVMAIQGDVGIYNECKNVFDVIKNNLPPLRGIMHAAGVLADAVIENQSWENFEKTFSPKVNGTWNLHKLSLENNLEHFILFSSVTSTVGSIAQSSYISANSFLDGFVHYRKGLGLHAQSINWGPWSEVGMASNSSLFTDDVLGIQSFSTKRGLSALKAIMQSNYSQVTVSELQPSITLRSFPHLKPYLSELVQATSKHGNSSEKEKLLKFDILKEIQNKVPKDQLELIKSTVTSIICKILRIDDSESVNCSETFIEMGMDSLLTVEFRNDLQQLLGDKVPINSSILLDSSIDTLSEYIFSILTSPSELLNENEVVIKQA